MREIYWLTRLDSIHTLFVIFTVIGGFAVVLSAIAFLTNKYAAVKHDYLEDIYWAAFWKKVWIFFLVFFPISIMGHIFVPTTREAYMIYGVGGTIEYLRNDSVASEIPHNAIVAVDEFVKSLNINNKSKNNQIKEE